MRTVSRWATSLLMILTIVSTSVRAADCDFSKGIEKLPDGRYAYSPECNRKVGKMAEDEKDRQTQIQAKDVQIKDLGVQADAQQKRADMWMDNSLKLEDRVNTMEELKARNQWLYFGLGIIVTGAAVWGAGQLRR